MVKITQQQVGGGGHLYVRLDIIFIKGLSKHTLNMYFSGMKIDPKIRVFACVFLNLSFPKFVNMTKNPHPFIFMYENRPYKYMFLHAFFLICPPCPFQNLSNDQKPHPFIFRYENRPYKYVFLHAFFLICPPCHFQNLSI